MVEAYYDAGCNMDLLEGKTVVITGYESRGHTHALNLKGSGVNVVIGLRPGSKSRAKTEEVGLAVLDTAETVKADGVIMILTLDQDQPDTYKKDIESNLGEGNMLMFVRSFPIHFNQIVAPADVDVTVCTPKGSGHTVRSQYQEGRGAPSLIVVHQDASGKVHGYALAYAGGIGVGRAGIIETTFKEETETDLFGGQAVLCGGICELIRAGFDTLVEADYELEVAYLEYIHEMKLTVDLINSGDFTMMRYSISDTAKYGDYVTGKRLIIGGTHEEIKKVLTEIRDGTFIGNWTMENRAAGRSHLLIMCRIHTTRPSEKIGEKLYKMMSRLKK